MFHFVFFLNFQLRKAQNHSRKILLSFLQGFISFYFYIKVKLLKDILHVRLTSEKGNKTEDLLTDIFEDDDIF